MVLLYASKYHDIRTVVNLSGRYDMKRGIDERFGKNFMERVRKDGFIEVKNSSGKLSFNWSHVSMPQLLWFKP